MSLSKMNHTDFLKDCEPYMLTNMNLLKYCKTSSKYTDYSDVYTQNIIKKEIGINRERTRREQSNTLNSSVKTVDNFSDIAEKDTLFWCFYIIKYGYDEYLHSTKRF